MYICVLCIYMYVMHMNMIIVGIPARPAPPTVDSGGRDSVVVMVTTQHSGVRDNAMDEFRFILKVFLTL